MALWARRSDASSGSGADPDQPDSPPSEQWTAPGAGEGVLTDTGSSPCGAMETKPGGSPRPWKKTN